MRELRDQNAINEALEKFQGMPDCLEKRLLNLSCMIAIKYLRLEGFYNFNCDYSSVVNEYRSFRELLKIEESNFEVDFNSLNKIGFIIENNNFRKFYENNQEKLRELMQYLAAMYKSLVPFDVNEFRILVNENEAVANVVKDKDIVLLLGGTGAGKSTLIQYLAGTKMKYRKFSAGTDPNSGFIETIEPELPYEQLPGNLKSMKISYHACSETRFLNCVEISAFKERKVGKRTIKDNVNLSFCDTPGFEDTRGPELNIANSLGIVNSIKQTKSVRPMIVFSEKDMGDRLQGLSHAVQLLSRLFYNVTSIQDNLCFVFNKFIEPAKYIENQNNEEVIAQEIDIQKNRTKGFFNNLIEHLSVEDRSDENFMAFIELLQDQVNEGLVPFVNPLDGESEEFITKEILACDPILNPGSAFKMFVSEESRQCIDAQIRFDLLAIKSAFTANRYDIIAYKLSQMKFLVDTLNDNSILMQYNNVLKEVLSEIERIFVKANEILEQFVSVNIERLYECFNEYMTLRDRLYSCERSFEIIISSMSFTKRIEEKFDYSMKSIHEEFLWSLTQRQKSISPEFLNQSQEDEMPKKIPSSVLLLNIRKQKFFLETLKEYQLINDIYNNSSVSLESYIKSLSEKVVSYVQNDNFSDAVSFIKELYKFNTIDWQQYLNLKIIQVCIAEVANAVSSTFTNDINNVTKLLNSQQLNKEAFKDRVDEQIKPFFIRLNNVKNHLVSLKIISIDDCNNWKQQVIVPIDAFITECYESIKMIFDNANQNGMQSNMRGGIFSRTKDQFLMVEILCQLPELPASMFTKFDEIKSFVLKNVRIFSDGLNVTLEKLGNGVNLIEADFSRLASGIKVLQQAEWIQHIAGGAYDIILAELYDAINYNVSTLVSKIKEISISLDNDYGRQELVSYFTALGLSNSLNSLVVGLAEIKEEGNKHIYDMFDMLSTSITNMFELPIDPAELKKEITELQQAMNQCETFRHNQTIEALQKFSSIEELRDAINEVVQVEKRISDLDDNANKVMSELAMLKKVDQSYMKAKRRIAKTKKESTRIDLWKEFFDKMHDKQLLPEEIADAESFEGGIEQCEQFMQTCNTERRSMQDKMLKLSKGLSKTQLEDIEIAYNKAFNFISAEMQEILHACQVNSLQSLTTLCDRKEQQLRNIQAGNCFLLNKFDPNNVTRVHDFFNWLEKNRVFAGFVGNIINQTKEKFYAFVNWRLDNVVTSLESDYSKLTELVDQSNFCDLFRSNAKEKEEVVKASFSLHSSLCSITLWQSKFPSIYEKIPCINLSFIQEWSRKLMLFAKIRILPKMKGCFELQNLADLEAWVDFVREIIYLDDFCDTSTPFSTIFAEYSPAIVAQAKDIALNANTALQNNDFQTLSENMADLKRVATDASNQSLRRLEGNLIGHLRNSISKISSEVSMLNTREINEQWQMKVMNIVEHLTTFATGLNFFQETLTEKCLYDTFETNLSNAKEVFSSKFIQITNQALNLFAVPGGNVEQAGEIMSRVSNVKNAVGGFISQVAVSSIDAYETRIKEDLKNKEEQYKTLAPEEYSFSSPKKTIEQLSTGSAGAVQFITTIENIKTNVRQRIIARLKEIETNSTGDEQKKAFDRLEGVITEFVPDTLVTPLKYELDNVKERAKNVANAMGAEVEINSTQTEDVQRLIACRTKLYEQNYHGLRTNLDGKLIANIESFKLEIKKASEKFESTKDIHYVHNMFEQMKKVYFYLPLSLQDETFVQIRRSIDECSSLVSSTIKNYMLPLNMTHKVQPFNIKFRILRAQIISSCKDFYDVLKYDSARSSLDPAIHEKMQLEAQSRMFSGRNVEKVYVNRHTFLCKVYTEHLNDFNKVLNEGKKLEEKPVFLKKIQDNASLFEYVQQSMFAKDLSDQPFSYSIANARVLKTIEDNLTYFKSVVLVNEETVGFELNRTKFYGELYNKLEFTRQLSTLEGLTELPKEHASDAINIAFKVHLKDQLSLMHQQCMTLIPEDSDSMTEENVKTLQINYDNIQALEQFADSMKARDNDLVNLIKLANEYKNSLVNKIKTSFIDKVWAKIDSNKEEMKVVSEGLIELYKLTFSFFFVADLIKNRTIAFIRNLRKDNSKLLITLINELQSDEDGTGASLVNDIPDLKMFANTRPQAWQATQNIEYVLNNISGPCADIDKSGILEVYQKFNELYQQNLKKHLKKGLTKEMDVIKNDIGKLVKNIDKEPLISRGGKVILSNGALSAIPKLMANIFALWTLKIANDNNYFDVVGGDTNDRTKYLYMPHPAQIVAIFRMLGIGYTDIRFEIPNNMVQVKTGEGKSVILAVTAIILALFKADVSSVCYSNYLSTRDYGEFLPLFQMLGVEKFIVYGTFDELCKRLLNKQGNLQTIISDTISKGRAEITSVDTMSSSRMPILLVDEVDVFLNRDFYGNVYSLSSKLQNDQILALFDFIWTNRNSTSLSLNYMKRQPVYQQCCAQFHHGGIKWDFLIDSAISEILENLKTYERHDYLVKDDRIAYKDQDGISFSISYRYNTLLAYYNENEKGKISRESLKQNIGLLVKCGTFSYAKLPSRFSAILGVTGTLEQISTPEREILHNEYRITKGMYMPSVYGENKRIFAKNADIKIDNEDSYYATLVGEINNRIVGTNPEVKRAVLVFFEDANSLYKFTKSSQIESLRMSYKILTEEANASEKKVIVAQASRSGAVTFLTRCFGRGTDFISFNPIVNANGGVHVIQTFLSEELSEEIQIMGRTARQGQSGSYSMVLLASSLETYNILAEDIEEIRSTGVFHDTLNAKRNASFEAKYRENTRSIGTANTEHIESEKFVNALLKGDIKTQQLFLGERNRAIVTSINSKTMVLMDATGSMAHLLLKAKNTVGDMFQRAMQVLKDNGIDPDCFKLQFATYRDYDCGLDGILQHSPWLNDPSSLSGFMSKIGAQGGGDYEEAIEIGLQHANKEAETGELSQVILIADAPAKNQSQIADYRRKYGGGDKAWSTKFGAPTFWQAECQKLQRQEVPVHTFYMANNAQLVTNFREIAKATSGSGKTARSEFLDVNGSQGAELLTNVVTEEILRNIGQGLGGSERGEQLVKAYRAKFTHT